MTRTIRTIPTTSDRLGAAAGAAYVVLTIVGNQVASGSTTDPHPSGAADLADFSATPTMIDKAGFAMELLGLLAFLAFLGWLVSALRTRGGAAAWLASTAGMAGAATIAIKLASVMPMTAGMIDHASLTPATARVLADMNGAAFVTTFLTFGTFLVTLGLAILASGFLGRAVGWAAVVFGGLEIGVTLVSSVDPVSTNPLPFLAGLLLVLVVSIRLAWTGPFETRDPSVDTRVSVPA